MKNRFLSYKRAQKITSRLGLNNLSEWSQYCKSDKKPKNIPINPHIIYKNEGWISYNNWLNIQADFLHIEEVKKINTIFKFKGAQEWLDCYYLGFFPKKMPENPQNFFYKNGWKGWKNFLNTENLSSVKRSLSYLSYEYAKIYLQDLNLKNKEEFYELFKTDNRPWHISIAAELFYKKSETWISWDDFLGASKKYFISYEEAKQFLKDFKLKKASDFFNLFKTLKRPAGMPADPSRTYSLKNTWVSWPDFLGYERKKKRVYVNYEEAKKYMIQFSLKNSIEFKLWRKNRPENIPFNPNIIYSGKGWVSWSDFLGKKTLTILELKEKIQSLGITTQIEYHNFRKQI